MDELKGNHNEITFCNLRFINCRVATFSTSSLAAQSLRFGYETSQTDSQHIAAKKFNELLQEKPKAN